MTGAILRPATTSKKCIKKVMPDCRELLALFSPWSRQRWWVKHEIGLADAYDKRVVCVFQQVRIEDFDPDEDGRGPIEDVNIIDLNSLDDYFEELKGRIGQADGK